jgi:KipI family sensor histidine kinase inhibitor
VHVTAAGDNAVLIELGEVSAEVLHASASNVRTLERVRACIPGYSSLYVICEGAPDVGEIARAASNPTADGRGKQRVHGLRVSFAPENAPDLDRLLSTTGLTRQQFLARIDGMRLTARHLGFRGGFAYLDGWPELWSMPRRETPRPHVPAGSFGVAGAIAGFYPLDSPGGWNILGRTDYDLAYAVAPGDVLVLEPTLADVEHPERASPPNLDLDYAEVISAPLALRVEKADFRRIERGMAPGGPFDELAAALANRAVGNPPDAPVLECAFAGPRLRFRRHAFYAWCDPDLQVIVGEVHEGQELAIGSISGGMRGYLAAGSSTVSLPRVTRADRLVIRCAAGPHEMDLGDVECDVTPRLDRVGIRLLPREPITASIPTEMRSCGMQFGTVQLHPDGALVVMGPDHPVTGGYLQPMTVLSGERWKLAQLVPGDCVRLVCIGRPNRISTPE